MRMGIVAGLSLLASAAAAAGADADAEGQIPAPFVPFEHMIGSWKGQGIPAANRLRGWPEKHLWAWKFAKGVPVGMSLTLEGNKTLSKAELTCDADGQHYRLQGTSPEGQAVTYVGTYGGTSASKMLTLERAGGAPAAEGKERLVIWPNSNRIRYVLRLDRQEAGAPQFKQVIEVGLTKEGESFAAGSSAADLPKCIITGGAATMTISYQGKTFPICCSGCRDEFNDNPEKYVKKATLRADQGGSSTPVKAAASTSSAGKDDGAFAGFGDDEKPRSKVAPRAAAPKAAEPPVEAPKAEESARNEARAASLLQLGQNLEKSGKAAAALPYYQRIVKELPGTAAAKTAAARVKALGGK
jgi:YHS domain-containing protein